MQIELTIDENELNRIAQEAFGEVKVRCQAAMGARFMEMTLQNFGASGPWRPETWSPLTSRYAKRYHGGDTTPTLYLRGQLFDSIKLEPNNPDGAVVSCDSPYGVAQQFGNRSGNLPARPFMPLEGVADYSAVTLDARDECIVAAQNELERSLK